MIDRWPNLIKALEVEALTEGADTTNMVPVRISELARQFFEQTDVGINIDDLYPNVAPPWDATWYEYSIPKKGLPIITEGEKIILPYSERLNTIAIVQGVTRVKEEDSLNAIRQDWVLRRLVEVPHIGKHFWNAAGSKGFLERSKIITDSKEQIGWIVSNIIFAEVGNNRLISLGVSGNYISIDGKLLPEKTGLFIPNVDNIQGVFPELFKSEFGISLLSVFYMPVWFCMGLLNCKNVETVSIPNSRFEEHHWRKKKKRGLVIYKTLNIHLPGNKKKAVNSEDRESDEKRSFHICRGHWADYREKGLFGKEELKGIYWIPQHTRGSLSEGEVRKAYNLKKKK